MAARLKDTYKNNVFSALMDQFKYDNVMEVPKLEKVTINMGLGEAKENAKIMESAVEEIGLITGQRPIVTKARKSIANFKVRQGMPVGAKVTLRGDNMYTFIDKLFNIALTTSKRLQGREQEFLRRQRQLHPWVSRNSLFSLKSSMIRSIKSRVWT